MGPTIEGFRSPVGYRFEITTSIYQSNLYFLILWNVVERQPSIINVKNTKLIYFLSLMTKPKSDTAKERNSYFVHFYGGKSVRRVFWRSAVEKIATADR